MDRRLLIACFALTCLVLRLHSKVIPRSARSFRIVRVTADTQGSQKVFKIDYESSSEADILWRLQERAVVSNGEDEVTASFDGEHGQAVFKTRRATIRDDRLYAFVYNPDRFHVLLLEIPRNGSSEETNIPSSGLHWNAGSDITYTHGEAIRLTFSVAAESVRYIQDFSWSFITANMTSEPPTAREIYGWESQDLPIRQVQMNENSAIFEIGTDQMDIEGLVTVTFGMRLSESSSLLTRMFEGHILELRRSDHADPFPVGSIALISTEIAQRRQCLQAHPCSVACYAVGNQPESNRLFRINADGSRTDVSSLNRVDIHFPYLLYSEFQIPASDTLDDRQYSCKAESQTKQVENTIQVITVPAFEEF